MQLTLISSKWRTFQQIIRQELHCRRCLSNDTGNTSIKCATSTKVAHTHYQQRAVSPQSKTKVDQSVDTYKFCIGHVEKYDRENYLAGLYIKDNLLKRVNFALRAFNVELSLIRDLANNSDRAKVRFHFWSKLIDEIVRRNEEPVKTIDHDKDLAYYRQTPVAKELLDLFNLVDLTKEMEDSLRGLIGARVSSKVLGYKQFETMDELELYCIRSNSAIYSLAWRVDMQFKQQGYEDCDNEVTPILESISINLGKAHGLSNIMRGIPYNSTKNCCYIPKDILDDFNLTNRDFIGPRLDGHTVKPVVKYIADRCRVLLSQVNSNLGRLLSSSNYRQYRHLWYLYLPRVTIESNLKKLKRYDHNICEPLLSRRNELLALNLKLASIHHKAPVL